MTESIPVPDWYFSVPEDADDATKLYMRAQVVIQAAFYAFGDPGAKEGTMTLGREELQEVVGMALAMLLSTDWGLSTRRDVRMEAERLAKYVGAMASQLREAGDDNPRALLEMLNMQSSRPN